MKNHFDQYIFVAVLLGFSLSFLLTKDVYLSLGIWQPLFNVLIFFVCIYIDIVTHEFGHAIAGWIVKFPIKRITIGFGHNIFKYKFNETTLVVNQGLQGGLIHPGTFSANFLRLRYFFFVLGGVGLQGIAIALVMATVYPLALNKGSLLLTIVNIFVFSNLFLIFTNLLPVKINIMGIPVPSDGLQLLTIFFKDQEKIQEILLSGKIIEGLELIEDKHFQEAEIIFRKCIIESPTFLAPKINLSVALIRQQKVDEAIGVLLELLTQLEQNSLRLLVVNNLAWSYFLKGLNQPECLNLADEYSAQAIKITNKSPHVVGTRACILIEIGEFDQGINLLKDHVSFNKAINEATNSAVCFLYLAYGYYLKGDAKQSQKYWQKINNYEDLKISEYRMLFDHVLKKTNYFTMP